MANHTATGRMEWIDDRWHLDGDGIHAGATLEARFPDGTWQRVRIESADQGKRLFALFDFHGLEVSVRVDPDAWDPLPLRWPD